MNHFKTILFFAFVWLSVASMALAISGDDIDNSTSASKNTSDQTVFSEIRFKSCEDLNQYLDANSLKRFPKPAGIELKASKLIYTNGKEEIYSPQAVRVILSPLRQKLVKYHYDTNTVELIDSDGVSKFSKALGESVVYGYVSDTGNSIAAVYDPRGSREHPVFNKLEFVNAKNKTSKVLELKGRQINVVHNRFLPASDKFLLVTDNLAPGRGYFGQKTGNMQMGMYDLKGNRKWELDFKEFNEKGFSKVAASTIGKTIVAIGLPYETRAWSYVYVINSDAGSITSKYRIGSANPIDRIVFSEDDSVVAVTHNGSLDVYDLVNNKRLFQQSYQQKVYSPDAPFKEIANDQSDNLGKFVSVNIALSPDGKTLCATQHQDNSNNDVLTCYRDNIMTGMLPLNGNHIRFNESAYELNITSQAAILKDTLDTKTPFHLIMFKNQ